MAHQVLTRAERRLLLAARDPDHPARVWMERRQVIALLAAREQALPDPRLRFILGDLVGKPPDDNPVEARRLLEQALSEDSESPLAGGAWFSLGLACDSLGDAKGAEVAYTQALERIWDTDRRAHLYANRGDVRVQRGKLGAAVVDYRQAVQSAEDPTILTLAYYGLGVALERSGDWPASLEAINTGTTHWPPQWLTSPLDMPGVFFVPAYEVYYYKALLATAAAERAGESSADFASALEQAAGHWQEYLEQAEPRGDRWVPNARSRLKRVLHTLSTARRKLGRATKRAADEPPAPKP
jgi:tetratricopeptide (TPR) repeat protein